MARASRFRVLAAAAGVAAVAVSLAVAFGAAANPGVDDPTPPAGYILLQQLSVPADGTEVTSLTLTSGVAYKIRASGTVSVGSGLGSDDADAEYVFDDTHTTVLDLACSGSVDMGLSIDDTSVDATKSPHWGDLSATHNYTTDFPGAGAALTFKFWDCAYGDNSGSLTVRIFVPASAVAAGARGLTAARGPRGVTVRWRATSDPTVLGFRVYRDVNGRRVRLTRLIVAHAGKPYAYVDQSAPRSARYWLQLVRNDGSRAWYGPARASS